MGKYIRFTEEQLKMANQIDLADYLAQQGEPLEKAGKEYRWLRHSSVTVKGNRWYQHKYQEGGYPIRFLQKFFGYTFQEAVQLLLSGSIYEEQASDQTEPIPFEAPERNGSMSHVYGYLLKQRYIDRKVLNEFTSRDLIYESASYHNVVFAGYDEQGIMRHAHKKSTSLKGKSFRGNESGSDPRYSFHWNGASNQIFVFEAPIDLLSYITLHQKYWMNDHYVALNGVSAQALLYQLSVHPEIQEVFLCLDHDIAGEEAMSRIQEELEEAGFFVEIKIQCSKYKDWNEDLKALAGDEAVPAVDSPKPRMFEHLLKRYCGQIKLATDSVSMKEIMDSYLAIYPILNSREENRNELLSDSLLRLVEKALSYRQQLGGKNTDPYSVLKEGYRSHLDRGDLEKRIEGMKEAIHKLKKVYTDHKYQQREKLLNKYLLSVAESCMRIVAYLDVQQILKNVKKEEIEMEQKPKCPMIGSDGNVFALLGLVQKTLKIIGKEKEAKEVMERVTSSESYEQALSIMMEYVEPTDVATFSMRIYAELKDLKRELLEAGQDEVVNDIALEVMCCEDTDEAFSKMEEVRNDMIPRMNLKQM